MIEEKFLVIFFLVLFFGVLIRALPLLKYTYVGIDSFFHLLVGEEITKKGRLPSKIGYFTISGTYAYPPLLHYIISYLLKYMSAKKVQFFSIIIDAINMGFIFIFGKYFFDEFVGIIGMALYASSPEVVKQSSNLNPRSLGLMMFLFSVSFFIFGLESPDRLIAFIWFCFSSLFFSFVLLTHKMATQTLLFTFIGFLFLGLANILDHFLLLGAITVVLFGFLLAFILTKGFYLKVLRAHIWFLKYYFHTGSAKSGKKSVENPLIPVALCPSVILCGFVILGLILNPFFSILNLKIESSDVIIILATWAAVCLVLSFLWPLGEAFRKILYATPPSVLLASVFIEKLDTIPATILVIGIFIASLFVIYKLISGYKPPFYLSSDILACYEFIKNLDENVILFSADSSYNYSLAYFTRKLIVGSDTSAESLNPAGKLYKKTFLQIIEEFEVTHIFVDNVFDFEKGKSSLLERDGVFLDMIYNSRNFGVYKIRKIDISN